MTNMMRLDNVAHADLRIATGFGEAYGDAVNQIALFLTEFEEAQRDYPILFLRPEGADAPQPVAILGLDRDENLFLRGGRWAANYIPALARRGPFLIGYAQGEPVIHVDLDHPRVLAPEAGEGEPLFLPQGGHAPALERAIEALRAIHVGHEAAKQAFALIDGLGLLQLVKLKVEVDEARSYTFSDYLAITSDRVAALDGAALARLNEARLLGAVVFAASSLGNMNRLAARKRAQAG